MTDQEYDALINSMSGSSPSWDDLDLSDLSFDFDTSNIGNLDFGSNFDLGSFDDIAAVDLGNLDLSGLAGMDFDSLGLDNMDLGPISNINLSEGVDLGGLGLTPTGRGQLSIRDPETGATGLTAEGFTSLKDLLGSGTSEELDRYTPGSADYSIRSGLETPDGLGLSSDATRGMGFDFMGGAQGISQYKPAEYGSSALEDLIKRNPGQFGAIEDYVNDTIFGDKGLTPFKGTGGTLSETGFLRQSSDRNPLGAQYSIGDPRSFINRPSVTGQQASVSPGRTVINNDDGTFTVVTNKDGKVDRTTVDASGKTVGGGGGGKSGAGDSKTTTPQSGLGALLPLLLALLAMNRGGGGGESKGAVIPALTATQRQTPYAQQQRAPGYRPGQGGITYFDQTQYAPKMASGGIVTLAEGGQTAAVDEGDAAEQTGNYTITENSVKSGRIATELDQRGQPSKFVYYSPEGKRLRTSTFSVPELLKNAQKYGIDLRDTLGVAAGLEKAGVGYKPGELYKGTGSDHGIDFRDLLSGGFGTSYNWADDPYAAQKGPSAVRRLAENKKLAEYLKLARSGLTSSSGVNPIDPSSLAQLGIKDDLYSYAVQTPGGPVSWYSEPVRAAAEAKRLGGELVDISNRPVVQMGNRNALDMIEDQLGMQAGSGTYSLPTDSFHNFQTTNPYVAPVKRPVRQSSAPDPRSASRGSIDRDVESDVRNLPTEATANNAASNSQTASGVTPYTQIQQAEGYRPGQGGITYFNPMRYAPKMAAGGGIARLLKGPGDGVSDSIPAMIGGEGMAGGGQPAKLARGEYVIDARTVAALGNGSTDAGAERLDKMRKDILRDDRKAGVGKDSKAYRHLLA
jgi:hypothetical protein